MAEAASPFGKRPAVATPLFAEIGAKRDELASAVPATAGSLWGGLHKLLLKAKVDPHAIMRLIASRDLAMLDSMIRWLEGEEPSVAACADEPKSEVVPPEVMKSAMKMFRKRLKFARLDAESRLGVGPMSSGKKSEIDAIESPREFSPVVWQALVAAGKLKREGARFYSLVNDDLRDD